MGRRHRNAQGLPTSTPYPSERNVYERWPSPPESLELNSDEVHVWRVSIPAQGSQLDRWRDLLSSDERSRADRFRFARDRSAYTTTRAVLRKLLARYLEDSPESLRFQVNKFGKPALTNDCNSGNIQFNVSHSGSYALLAFGREIAVGVDVEQTRSVLQEIANSLLSPSEKRQFLKLPEKRRRASLLQAWTSKEAVIKALGKGLSIPLEEVEVLIDPENPPSLVRLSPEIGNAHDWTLHGLSVDEDYSAAVAVGATVNYLKCWNWGE